MHHVRLLAALAAASSLLPAQETYWIANRASNDIMQVTAWGSVLRRIDMGTGLRSAHTAPDGKVWVIRFIQPTFDIVDPVAGTITPVAFSLGSPYSIAFDNQGTAWVSGGTGVEQYAPNGTSIQAIPLPAAAPLGITIDAMNNKWIAHRASTPSVSRIDASNVVTNFPIVGAAAGFQPVAVIADFRGFVTASHLWVTGDGPSQLVEMDDQGNTLNVYPLPVGSTGIAPVFDLRGDIWVGSFGTTGSLMQVDETNGAVLNTYAFPPSINGLAVDSFDRIWATARVTFSGVGPPCEVRRIDPATGAVEIPALLQVPGFSSAGTQSGLSTPFQYALVVAPFGDMDNDGVANASEVMGNTSPIDACSNSAISINTTGVTANGSTASLEVQTSGPDFWGVYFATGIVPRGSGITVPGVGCEALLDPVSLFSGVITGVGTTSLPIGLPASPAYIGFEVFMQGFVIAPSVLQFSNVTGLKIW